MVTLAKVGYCSCRPQIKKRLEPQNGNDLASDRLSESEEGSG